MAEPIEMSFGMWGGVAHSDLVLDGGPDPPIVKGNLGDLLPIENHWDRVLPSVQRHLSLNPERCTTFMMRFQARMCRLYVKITLLPI